MRRFDVITFDCYGTLIDWESGIRAAFAAPVVEHEKYRSYRDVLKETASRIAPHAKTNFLADSLPSWKPFRDTNPALERLVHYDIRLGILSNVDDDLIGETCKHFTVDFELVITAQQVRSYKPGHAHFLTARQRIGDAKWLHAAQSNFHDIVPANTLGIANAWINRNAETALAGGVPTFEFRDLTGLADAMT